MTSSENSKRQILLGAVLVLLSAACVPESGAPEQPSMVSQAVEGDSGLSVVITSPAEGAFVNTSFASITATASATPPAMVSRVEFWEGTTKLFGPPFGPPWMAPIPCCTMGPRTIRAIAFDAAGNSVTATRNFIMDFIGPIAILQRAGGQPGTVVSGTVPLTVAGFDAVSGVDRFELYDGPLLIASGPGVPQLYIWNTASVAAGPHELKLLVWDKAGNISQPALLSLSVFHDTVPPMVAITSPSAGAGVSGVVQVGIAVSDDVAASRAELYDGTQLVWTIFGPPASMDVMLWDTMNAAAGPHTLTVKAYDSSGNSATSAPLTVIVDRTAPSVAVTLTPSEASVLSGVVSITAEASDDVAVTLVTFYDGDAVLATFGSPPYAHAWNTAAGADGPHTIKVRAVDQVGNVTERTVAVTVDNSVSVTLVSPVTGTVVGQTATLTAQTTNDAAVASLSFFTGTTLIGTVTAPPFTLAWNPAAAGAHSLTVQATDKQGRVTTSPAVEVTADPLVPEVSLVLPLPGSVAVSGPMPLLALARDNVAVVKVEFYDGVTLIGTELNAPYTQVWNTTGLARGVHTLTARAHDAAGNVTVSAPVSVTLLSAPDTTAPTVAITAPAKGTRVAVGSVVTIAANAADANGIARVEFYVGGALKCVDAQAPYTCAWTVPSGKGKSYSLTAKAVDTSRNARTSAAVTVTSR
jgi:hypothetical protein